MAVRVRRVLSVLTFLLAPATADACPVCFGGIESPLLDGARLGVLALALVTVCVLGAFAAWFRRLARLEAEATRETS
jgi:hypothetical protein